MSALANRLPWLDGPNDRRLLLVQLPDDLLCMIFDMLAFKWMLHMSHTCRRLRRLASLQSKLWQALPAATGGTLHTLEPFVLHSRTLGFDLTIYNIAIEHLTDLCRFLKKHFDKLRTLHLRFADLPDGITLDGNALLPLHKTLSKQAPLLEDLSLDGNFYEPFLGGLRSDILGGAAALKLRKLSLTAFSLAEPCPGFQCVKNVVTTIGALSPKSLASDNLDVHGLFPAIEHLELSGIDAERENNADNAALHRLVRVPFLTAPLATLTLKWYKNACEGAADDPRATGWLAMSLPHVQEAYVTALQCAPVSQIVLAADIEKASALRLTPAGRNVELELWASGNPQRLRSAVMTARQARKQVAAIIEGAEHLRLDMLVISTHSVCVKLLKVAPASWDALGGVRTLSLIIDWSSVDADGWFIDLETLEELEPLNRIQTLHVQAPADMQRTRLPRRSIAALCLTEFVQYLLPNAKTAVLCLPDVQVSDPELLAVYPHCSFSYISSH